MGHARLGSVRDAVEALERGHLAAFPTEADWAVACRVDSPAVQGILRLKGRAPDAPLAVGFATWQEALLFIRSTAGAERLAVRFLPGPLTIVVEREGSWLDGVAGGHATIAVRVPSHPVAQELLRQSAPVAMARPTSLPGTTTPQQALAALGPVSEPVVVVDAGETGHAGSGRATVVGATRARPELVREGNIAREEVESAWT